MNTAEDIGSADRLTFTLFLAAALHALVIFGITFTIDSGNRIAPTLNITLATHSSQVRPERADFIAQHDQLASGTADSVKELTTRDQATLNDVQIRDLNPAPSTQASAERIAKREVVATQSRSPLKIYQPEDTNSELLDSDERTGEDRDSPLVDPEFASLRAKLDRLKQELARQPRIRRLTSVSTQASYDARYLNDWAQKIEAIGNENFPREAIRDEIFGFLRLSVMILPDGTIENVEILQSSQHSILDEAAMRIVRLASPFKPFPKEIRQNTDKLEIIRTWRFEITGLKTTR